MSDYSNLFSHLQSSQRQSQYFTQTHLQGSHAFHPNLLFSPIHYNQNDSYQSNLPIPEIQQIQAYNDLNNYITNVLKSWCLTIGSMMYSSQNMKTLNCLMQLIKLRQKDMDYRGKVQQDIAKIQFQTSTTKSALNRTTTELQNCRKMLGSLENKSRAQQLKLKKEIDKLNSEKNQLIQIRQKLQQKNNQALHQIKKKQVEFNRVKQSLKKGNQKGTIKNGFDNIACLPAKIDKNQSNINYQCLKQKYQNERKVYIKQNLSLRQQLQQYSIEINTFIKWIKQTHSINQLKQKNMQINHNLIFKKQSLVQQLRQALNLIKKQIISLPQQEKPKDNKQNTLKKKTSIIHQSSNNIPAINISPNIKNQVSLTSRELCNKEDKYNVIHLKKKLNQNKQIPCEIQKTQPKFNEDISIISHISVKDMDSPKLRNKKQFNKWDILWDE